MADEDFALADRFAEIARDLASRKGKDAVLERICTMAVEIVDACDHAGVTMVEGSVIRSVAASDDVPRAVDRVQDEAGDGPCFDAIRQHEIFTTGSLASETRWPEFSRRAFQDSGVQSILSVRLFCEGDTLGSINLYSRKPDAFDDDDVHVATILAAHAAVAVVGMRQEERFHEAIETRDVIGRAKGILAARSGASDEEAFNMLRSASQRMNIKLRDVARGITEGAPQPGSTDA